MILRGSRVENPDGTERATVVQVYPDGQGGIDWLMVLWDEAMLTNSRPVRVHVSQVVEVIP